MKAAKVCYPCLANLVRQAAELAADDNTLRAKAVDQGLKLLEREFSTDKTSISIVIQLHRVVREVTGNTDPYSKMKEAEVDMARRFCTDWKLDPEGDIRHYLMLSVLGNNMDFFKDMKQIKEGLSKPVEFSIDGTSELEEKLKSAKDILYLADNSGEVFFDIPLIKRLSDFAPVTYVVKESPVQNDITKADLEKFDLARKLPRVITTGTNTPGVDMDMASAEFKAEFEAADLILAKGMGYWETLSELPPRSKVFYLLKAKCKPVADSLGVALNSYVFLLR